MFGRIKRSAEFLDFRVGAFAHVGQYGGMLGVSREVDEFIGIIFEIVEKFGVVIDVADVFVSRCPDSFVGRDAVTDGEVFVEGFGTPIFGSFPVNDGLEAASVVAIRGLKSGPVEEGGGEVDIESGRVADLSVLSLGNARVGDDEGDLDGFLEV